MSCWLAQPLTAVAGCRGSSSRYASQIHSDPRPNLQALFLNTRVPPFDRLDVRRAMNFAVDRAAATNAWGGPNVAEPTCQILPPNFPGYRPYCPYTAGSTKQRQVDGTRPDDGEGARRTLRDARHEGHRLGVERRRRASTRWP